MSEGWTKEKPYPLGDPFYEALLDAIGRATKSIDFEAYIFANDSLGNIFVKAISDAAKRGVKTRVIVDGVGSLGWGAIFGNQLAEAGAEYKVFHPLPWDTQIEKVITGRRGADIFRSALSRINKRTHRKLVIIDERIAFVGSRNISGVHSESLSRDQAWNDLSVELEGSPILDLIESFNRVWIGKLRSKDKRQLDQKYPELVRLNDTRFRRRRNYFEMRRRIATASKRVWIVGSYFVPPRSLLRAMRAASTEGVDVRLLVPYQSDVFFVPWIISSFQYGLLKSGVKLYEYTPSILHAKIVIVDDWFVIGSSNMNHRSILHDLEVDVVLRAQDSVESIGNKFLDDLSKSREITMESWKTTPILRRFAGRILLMFKNLL